MRDLGIVRIAGGAIGEPGRRTFYLQIDHDEERLWFVLEKQQLAALTEGLLEMLAGLELSDGPEPPEIVEPTAVAFRVGEIVIGGGDGSFSVTLRPSEAGKGEEVRFQLEYAVALGMAEAALRVVAAGRPLCRFCHLPKDPEGHACPATNGHRGKRLES